MPENSTAPRKRPRRGALGIADRLDSFVDVIGRGTAWTCLAIVIIVANNVILRYVFRIGPVSLQELEWHLMSPIALIGMSYAMRHGDHVRVDIFYDRFGRKVREFVDLFSGIAAIVISLIVIALSLKFVDQAYRINEGSPDPGGLTHRFLLKSFIPLGFALVVVQATAMVIRNVILLVRGDGDGE